MKKSTETSAKVNRLTNRLSGGNGRADFSVLLITIILCIFGLIMVYSSSFYIAINTNGTPNYYLIRQAIFEATGFVLLIIFANIDYHVWVKMWPIIYAAGLGLLVLVLLIGNSANGSQRWIQIGPLTIMPGEMAKAFIIITVTGFLAKKPSLANNLAKGIFPVVGLAGVYLLLIMAQPNMSTAFTVLFIVAGLLFVAGTSMPKLLLLGLFGLIAAGGYVATGYRWQRVQSMLDPFSDALGSGYQVVQSLLALGSGGLTGLGLGNSVQKNLYLPFPHNDFILSVIGEELGYVGIILLMITFLLLIWRGLRIALHAPDYEGMMIASGIIIMIAVQVLMNVAVVTSLMPPTGVILPFVSYGGNAMWIFLGLTGMLINVSKQIGEEE